MNFRQPDMEEVDKSVRQIANKARNRANIDHDWSFASDRERDHIALTYIGRSYGWLKDQLD